MAKSFEIDIDRVLDERLGSKSWLAPRPLRKWLKRLAHQDDFNDFLSQEGDRVGVPWLDDAIRYLHITLDVKGRENLPPHTPSARYTFVSNHPLGGLDGISVGSVLGHAYDGRIRYLVNDLLMNLPGLAPLCVPVNKTGAQSRNLPTLVRETFASDNHVIMFPAGLCSRLIDGRIQDLPWQKTFIAKSVETQRDVVPLFFEGQNSPRFYRIARWCKRLGLKVNLAMLYLPDEMFQQTGAHLTLHIGKPIPWQTFTDRSRTPAQWAQWVRGKCYELEVLSS